MSRELWAHYSDTTFRNKALGQTLKASEVNKEAYDACYYTGGHGVLWDFPQAKGIKALAEGTYQDGGFVSAVCHGVVGLLALEFNNRPLIDKKRLTGFSNFEEKLIGARKKVPFLTGQALKERGAEYFKDYLPFIPFALRDGRLITGQNPQSPKKVARLLLEALKEV